MAVPKLSPTKKADAAGTLDVGALLSRTSSGDLGPNRVVERPKVIYNDNTRKYVLWMHMDSSSYGEARVAVATGDSVCGKYTYIRSFQP